MLHTHYDPLQAKPEVATRAQPRILQKDCQKAIQFLFRDQGASVEAPAV